MSEPADLHDWLAFDDADGDSWLVDATFLASSWCCIYGAGCPGIEEEKDVAGALGCCSNGAHFSDKADRRRVREQAALLTADQWQFKAEAEDLGGPIAKNEDGEWTTVAVRNACVFLNRPGFHRGAGCALHVAALDAGERPLDWKPEVCWQLPLRLDSHVDDNEHTTWILREWRRHDWGEGGVEFAWWCTEEPEAFVGAEPVYKALHDELVELCGEEPYQKMAATLAARGERVLPHPVVRRRT